jgi:GTPase SAR1 family protein
MVSKKTTAVPIPVDAKPEVKLILLGDSAVGKSK